MSHKLYGKYRGAVLDNIDPLGRGRIIAEVPDALGLTASAWAEACAPLAGVQSGVYLVPEIGAGVWIEFERGDPGFPIRTGCRWESSADVPPLAQTGSPANPPIVLQTPGGAALMLSDAPGATGGIVLKTAGGATISISDSGISIANGKGAVITLIGPTVDVNNGAWTVT
jgi:uncharacterized protein involved in type VI secretion and phage assembly